MILKKVNEKYYRVILDMQNIEFIDSAAIGMLLNLNEELKKSGYDFSIINVSGQMMELLNLVPAVKEMISSQEDKFAMDQSSLSP